jgi:hypothetical protein
VVASAYAICNERRIDLEISEEPQVTTIKQLDAIFESNIQRPIDCSKMIKWIDEMLHS